MKTYSHSGDLGDLLASLCTLRQMCSEIDLVLPRSEGLVREAWTPAKVERVKSFLEMQPYIKAVRYADAPEGENLDVWRKKYRRGINLSDIFADAFGVPRWDRTVPWCEVDYPVQVAKVVLHRSPRYHGRGERFPWREVVRRYKGNVVMVGSVEEHAEFTKVYGEVPYHETPTLLDLSRVIAGSELMCCNQSSPGMLCESLKKPRWLEQGLTKNCHWKWANAWYDLDRPPVNCFPELR
jgi:hypothetical protein